MRLTLVVFLVALFFFVDFTYAQTIRLAVDGGRTVELTAKDLATFERRELNATGHDGRVSNYAGFALRDLLISAGARILQDQLRGKEIAAYVVVEGTDGYKAVFSITEFSAEFTDRVVLIADQRDGAALSKNEGPFQIIVPDDKKHGRWVRNVKSIMLRKVD